MLGENQFDVLSALETNERLSQRDLAQNIGLSVGTINKTINDLKKDKLVDAGGLTQKGISALEPYRVKRAIFLAAGFGSRLVPITLNTPKPLVRVKGVRIIDTLLDAVIAAGITDIVVVRGYLGEQFDQLLYKYPMIKFIENPSYNESNNIASAYCVRYLLSNAYVLESDLLLKNPKLITKYQYQSNYLAAKVDRTDDWCFETKNNVITQISVGGLNCHQMFGISYWDNKAGKCLANDIKTVFEMPGGKERYWDQVALQYCLPKYKVMARECNLDDIIEIDTYNELKKLDSTYI